MNTTVLKTAALRVVVTFVYAFAAALAANTSDLGINLSPLHALEIAAIAGLVAVAHSLPTTGGSLSAPPARPVASTTVFTTAGPAASFTPTVVTQSFPPPAPPEPPAPAA